MKPKVQLTGNDGNAFVIMEEVHKAFKKFYKDPDWAQEKFDEYRKEAESGDYDHLIQTTMKYCDVK